MKISQEKGHFLSIMNNEKVNMKRNVSRSYNILTMAYIIAVNPSILSSTGMPAGALLRYMSCCLGCL